jgi:hypothetical protein
MAIKLRAIGVSNSDKNKADPNVRHRYVPDFELMIEKKLVKNRDLPEDDQIYVICDHITIADGDKYNRMKTDSTVSYGGVDVFRDKVKEIHNLLHPTEDREITPKEFLEVFGSIDAIAIKFDVAKHLLNAGSLGDEEIKN